VPKEFHHLFSLFLNILSCHQKCLYGNLFNANETYMKLSLRLTLVSQIIGHAASRDKNERKIMSHLVSLSCSFSYLRKNTRNRRWVFLHVFCGILQLLSQMNPCLPFTNYAGYTQQLHALVLR
jgi:hypothetical protein